MTVDPKRRVVLQATLAVSALSLLGLPLQSRGATALRFGPPQPFSFDRLKQRAGAMAATAHVSPPRPAPDITAKIDYAAHGQIKFRADTALAAEGPGNFPVTFFHLGMFFQKAVKMHAVRRGEAREIIYRADYFDMPADSIARRLPEGAGFAGFRIQESRAGKLDWHKNDWVAFLGASYFRAIGELYQYGLSARGLALWTGTGERLWRPLNNPPGLAVSAFGDDKPRGFGLSQRDRNFDHYLDGVRYDLRPSLWVEPLAGFDRGAVQLIELPTDDEIHDNANAMWVPAEPARAGGSFEFKYSLHWSADKPFAAALARCVATRLGNGGVPGLPRPKGVRKFMVEFLGAPLAKLPFGVKPEAVLWASRGEFSYVFTEAGPDDVLGHWRAQFDLTVQGTEPVEMRLYLKIGADALSQTS